MLGGGRTDLTVRQFSDRQPEHLCDPFERLVTNTLQASVLELYNGISMDPGPFREPFLCKSLIFTQNRDILSCFSNIHDAQRLQFSVHSCK